MKLRNQVTSKDREKLYSALSGVTGITDPDALINVVVSLSQLMFLTWVIRWDSFSRKAVIFGPQGAEGVPTEFTIEVLEGLVKTEKDKLFQEELKKAKSAMKSDNVELTVHQGTAPEPLPVPEAPSVEESPVS